MWALSNQESETPEHQFVSHSAAVLIGDLLLREAGDSEADQRGR
jgi:hypothetical protein